MKKPVSGTVAAKMIGVGNNLSFVRKFVETNQILPVVFPGAKRKLYDPDDVERLVFLNKHRQEQRPSVVRELIESIKNKHLRS